MVSRCSSSALMGTLSMADLHDPRISTLRSRESFTISTCLDQERVICGRGPGIKADTILRQAAEMWRRLTGDCKNMTLQSSPRPHRCHCTSPAAEVGRLPEKLWRPWRLPVQGCPWRG